MKRHILSIFISSSLGILFFLSGFVKAMDPIGFSYKISEYLSVLGIYKLIGWSISLSITLCTMELSLGIILLLRVWMKTAAICAIASISAFTSITLMLVSGYISSITECGCFGEAIHLSNSASFAKNIMLEVLAIIHTYFVFKEKASVPFSWHQITIVLKVLSLSMVIPILSYVFLPPFYFLSYNVGSMIHSDNKIELFDQNLNHVEMDIMGNEKPLYVIGLRRELTDKEAAKIAELYEAYTLGKVNIIVITHLENLPAGSYTDIPCYYIDESMLKSILRCESGIVAISDGVITGKWNLEYTSYSFRGHYGEELFAQIVFRYGTLVAFMLCLIHLFIMRYHVRTKEN